jgi:polyisoprenoid-binding protein YceI
MLGKFWLKGLVSVTLGVLIHLAPARAQEACEYQLDSKNLKVEWTAFKTTEKLGVKGSFTDARYQGLSSSKSLKELIRRAQVKINPQSLETGNPARNINILEGFFKKLSHSSEISGKLSQDGSSTYLHLKLNGKTKKLPLQVKWGEDGILTLSSALNVLDFQASSALKSINELCYELHKGKDGVSKTWPDVDLMITLPYVKKCN